MRIAIRSSSRASAASAACFAGSPPRCRRRLTIQRQPTRRGCSEPAGPFARWAGPTRTGCCAGCRWRWRIWPPSGSKASRCAPRSRRAGCWDRFSVHGPPAVRRSCSCSERAKANRWRTAGSRQVDRARSPTRWRRQRGSTASRSGPARTWCRSTSTTTRRPAPYSRPVSVLPHARSCRAPIRSARSAWSTRLGSTRRLSGVR